MSDIFNEIDDELRQEKLQKFWHDSKYFIIGAIMSAILFTASFGFWQDWKNNSNIEETTKFYNALNTTEIETLVNYSKTAKNNHAALAKLSAASLYIDKNKIKEAMILLQEIQKNRNIDKLYRDFAILIEANQSLDSADKKTLAYLEKKLIPLTGTNSVWSLSIQETLVLIAAKQEDYKKAIAIIDRLLTASNITKGMGDRLAELRVLYNAQQMTISTQNNNGSK